MLETTKIARLRAAWEQAETADEANRIAALAREGHSVASLPPDPWRSAAVQPVWHRDNPPNPWAPKVPAATVVPRDARGLPDGWQAKQASLTVAAGALPDGWARGGGR